MRSTFPTGFIIIKNFWKWWTSDQVVLTFPELTTKLKVKYYNGLNYTKTIGKSKGYLSDAISRWFPKAFLPWCIGRTWQLGILFHPNNDLLAIRISFFHDATSQWVSFKVTFSYYGRGNGFENILESTFPLQKSP